MRDSEVVASITAGDPLGLAAAYDRYSGPLFGYCQTLLDEPADAADAVQDTFVIAASKLTTLRDPERLRAWLFAVARNECLHRLKSRQAAAPLAFAPDRADDSADVSAEAERAEARALIRAAVGGLNAGERDVINQLWHGLEVREVAAVLGVSRNHAYSLFSRALDQLETSVAVLLVGRSGRKDCAALDQLLAGWDGRLTAPLRKRVGRHIERCQVCSDRRRQALTPALLYDLTPAAILGLALAHRVPLPAQLAGVPAALRGKMLRLATDPGRHAAAYRAGVTRSTGPFHPSGFPKAAHAGHVGLTRVAHATAGATATTATVTVAVTATAVVTAIAPQVHSPLMPGGAIGRGPTVHVPTARVPTVHMPTDGRPPASGTDPAGLEPITLAARTVYTQGGGKGKHQAHTAKRAGRYPWPGKHAGAWGGDPYGGGGDNGNGFGNGHGYANGNGNGSANGNGNWYGSGNSDSNGSGQGNSNSNGSGQGNSNRYGNGNGQGNGNGRGQGNGGAQGNGSGSGNGRSSRTLSSTPILQIGAMPTAAMRLAGKFAVSPGTVAPSPLGALTLTANSGPVTWSAARLAADRQPIGRHAAGSSRDADRAVLGYQPKHAGYQPRHARYDADGGPWGSAGPRAAWGGLGSLGPLAVSSTA